MTQEISIDLISNNKFNPKKSMSKEESEFLKNSLSEWGHAGSITVCDDYENKGKFIVIEGNSRLRALKSMGVEKVDAVILPGIDSEQRLKKVTLDFVTATKRRDHKALFELYDELDLQDVNVYKDVFGEIEEAMKGSFSIPQVPVDTQKFRKAIVVTFTNEESYDRFKLAQGKHAERIGKNSKLVKLIEQYSDIDEFMSKYFLDIMFRFINELEED